MKAKFIYEAKPKTPEDVDKELRSMSEKKLREMMHSYNIDKKRLKKIESILIEKYPKILKELENSSVKELLQKTRIVYSFKEVIDFEDYIIQILAKKWNIEPANARDIFRLSKMVIGNVGDEEKTQQEILKYLEKNGLKFFKYFKGFENKIKTHFDYRLLYKISVDILKNVLNIINPESDTVDNSIQQLFYNDKSDANLKQKIIIFLEYLDKYPADEVQPLNKSIALSVQYNKKDIFELLMSKEYHKDLDLNKIHSTIYGSAPKWFKEYKVQASGSYLAKYQDDLFKVMKLMAKGGSMYSAHDEFDPNRLTKNEQKELLSLMKKISEEDASK